MAGRAVQGFVGGVWGGGVGGVRLAVHHHVRRTGARREVEIANSLLNALQNQADQSGGSTLRSYQTSRQRGAPRLQVLPRFHFIWTQNDGGGGSRRHRGVQDQIRSSDPSGFQDVNTHYNRAA